jgi:hypothetical protein
MELEARGKCDWVLGRYLILRKTYGSSFFYFVFSENIWKETKNLWLYCCCCCFLKIIINLKISELKNPKF